MNIKKKIISLLLCGAMTLSFVGCNNSDKETKETTKKPTKENVWITDHESFKYLETFGYELVECDENATGEVVIPKGITHICPDSFNGVDNVTKIIFQEGVQYINETFSGMHNLEEVILPDSLLHIEYPFFNDSENITVTYKGKKYAYADFEELNIKINNQKIPKPTEPDFLIDNGVLGRCRSFGFSEVVVPDEVKVIKMQAFTSSCFSLERIILPDGLEKAEAEDFDARHAFYSFDDRTIVFKGKEYVGKESLRELYIAINGHNTLEPVYEINDGKLLGITYDDYSVNYDYTIPDDVKYVVSNCHNINPYVESVTIPEGVTFIGSNFLSDTKNLERVTLPDSLKYIGKRCFKNASYITYKGEDFTPHRFEELFELINTQGAIGVTEPLFAISNGILYDCVSYDFTDIVIPDSVYEIRSSVFNGCTNLKKITIAESVYEIGNGAFGNCTGLTNVTIPYGVRLIGSNVFEGCTNLKNITIAESVYEIGHGAFRNCTGLTNVTIPYGVKSIESSTFENCTSLTNVTIPDSVTEIDTEAFKDCTSLTNITIPDMVTLTTGDNAFNGCENINFTYRGKTYTYDNIQDLYDAINNWQVKNLYTTKTPRTRRFRGYLFYKSCKSAKVRSFSKLSLARSLSIAG